LNPPPGDPRTILYDCALTALQYFIQPSRRLSIRPQADLPSDDCRVKPALETKAPHDLQMSNASVYQDTPGRLFPAAVTIRPRVTFP
jgi:hypothetical protein